MEENDEKKTDPSTTLHKEEDGKKEYIYIYIYGLRSK